MNWVGASNLGLSQPNSSHIEKTRSLPFRKQFFFTNPKGDPFDQKCVRLSQILPLQIPGAHRTALGSSPSDLLSANQRVKISRYR